MASNARTKVGPGPFMAPELSSSSPLLRTPKMDVWSLFVTPACAVNGTGFRRQLLSQTTSFQIQAIQDAVMTSYWARFATWRLSTQASELQPGICWTRSSPEKAVPPRRVSRPLASGGGATGRSGRQCERGSI
ncbi:hypothetical protein B0J13DRAFT_174534 [Dactylonectria estremocensis]|uniref:Uncharacterized protein n=1 Tax=Dactylonectria estremocensis TaxID=1079267 RepID=A0A9P9JH06_9HYPO|nr:hypothetical protein B0J13DRAFT_174534 [Dactylonectria estremocensis]